MNYYFLEFDKKNQSLSDFTENLQNSINAAKKEIISFKTQENPVKNVVYCEVLLGKSTTNKYHVQSFGIDDTDSIALEMDASLSLQVNQEKQVFSANLVPFSSGRRALGFIILYTESVDSSNASQKNRKNKKETT